MNYQKLLEGVTEKRGGLQFFPDGSFVTKDEFLQDALSRGIPCKILQKGKTNIIDYLSRLCKPRFH